MAALSTILSSLVLLSPGKSFSGGSGLNTVIVINQNSTNSCELGNYYAEARGVAPDNVLRISWGGGNTSWTENDFTNVLLNPLLSMVATRGLSNQIDYVVLSMDIPFITIKGPGGTNLNSTTSALFYGLKPDANGSGNAYAATESSFRNSRPATVSGSSFLTMMLTGDTLAEAKSIVDRGVASDSTFPTGAVFLEKTSDYARNTRYGEFDIAIFNANILGRGALLRTNSDSPAMPGPLIGLQTGLPSFSLNPNEFAPGALADNMTSFGGVIFGSSFGQTTLLSMIAAGATASYGTVDEPFSDVQKFPSPMDYFYQERGFSLAESYYQSVKNPYLGLTVGEPLAAPFAQPGKCKWLGITSNTLLSATCLLSNSAAGGRPMQKMDLFVDGKFFQTVTNITPKAGNVLNVNIEGFPISYIVPSNATLATVVTGLVATINTQTLTNVTKVVAFPFGDRIELRSMTSNYLADPFFYVDTTATGAIAPTYRIDYLPFPDQPRFNAMFMNLATGFDLRVETTPGVPCVVEASPDMTHWLPITTNFLGGVRDIIDADALNYPQRFYRLMAPNPSPFLSVNTTNGAAVNVHVRAPTTLPYVIQQSPDLKQWTPVLTNTAGTNMDWLDPSAAGVTSRFYRVMTLTPMLAAATVTTSTNKTSGGEVVSVSKPARGYVLRVSTDSITWTYVQTNSSLTEGQISASSDVGSADALTTFISTARSTFVSSPALGWRTESVSSTDTNQQAQAGTWLQLKIVKTNGTVFNVAVTNQTAGIALSNVVLQLMTNVNAALALQASDGVLADDFQVYPDGSIYFKVYARTPGFPAAGVKAQLSASSDLNFTGGTWPLTMNLSDLQARNHLYLTTGVTPLIANLALDTTALPDGYHDLTMVAYEGSSVAMQTRTTIPVQIRNTALSASLNLLDLTDGSPVQGTYHVQVAANTNTVSQISLFTTGGLLATITNQPSATFNVDGTSLCAGLHPFYALVQTTDGFQYRTETKYARLINAQ